MTNQPSFSRPVYLLRSEGFWVLLASSGAYQVLFPHHWVMFACLFLVPDLTLLTYARGTNAVAASAYNVMHSYVLPVLLGILAVPCHSELLGKVSLIWMSHIGMDRALGYGLKYPSSFQFTHIQSAANPAHLPSLPARSG